MTKQTSGESRPFSGIAVLVLFGFAIASNNADPRLIAGDAAPPAFDDPIDFGSATIAREAILRLPSISVPGVVVTEKKNSEQCL